MKNHQFDTLEDCQAELDHLQQMIREAESIEDLNDLHHYVGMSEAEQAKWEANNRRLDALDKRVDWSKQVFQCSSDEISARLQWESIMRLQKEIEAKYC